jgi:serine/threonine-protein kinase
MTQARAPIPASPQLPRPSAPRAAPRSLVGRVIGDRYGVTGLIGTGGTGAVYEAEHLAIGRLVAVKVLQDRHAQDKAAVARLKHEARVAGTIGHPNICAVYDMGRLEDGNPYIVMERLYGETLAQRIKRKGAVPVPDAIDLALQVLSALVAAHRKGVIHRDLKPHNIFLSHREGMRPVAKLLDFGIAKSDSVEDSINDIKGLSAPLGTPYYLAPEQARGERNIDQRVDVWAAGVVLYEMLTGKRPFVARNYNALLVQILTMKPLPLRQVMPGLHPSFDGIVERALAKAADERFATAEAFLEALRRFKRDEQPPSIRAGIIAEETTSDGDKTTVFRREAVERLLNGAVAPTRRSATPSGRGHSGPKHDGRPKQAVPAPPSVPKKAPKPELPKLYEDDDSTIVDSPRALADFSFSDTATTIRQERKRRR